MQGLADAGQPEIHRPVRAPESRRYVLLLSQQVRFGGEMILCPNVKASCLVELGEDVDLHLGRSVLLGT